jgi:hypothetical protein
MALPLNSLDRGRISVVCDISLHFIAGHYPIHLRLVIHSHARDFSAFFFSYGQMICPYISHNAFDGVPVYPFANGGLGRTLFCYAFRATYKQKIRHYCRRK